MFWYVALYGYSAINAIFDFLNSNKKIARILNKFLVFLLIFFSGTRYYLGGEDYYIYSAAFNSIPKIPEFISNFNNIHELYYVFGFEKGYLFLNSLIKTIGFNFQGFTLIHSILFYVILFKALSRYNNKNGLIIVIFLYKMFFYNTFISLRQSLTIALFLYSIKYIEEKKVIKYFTCCFVSLQIHSASIILFPLYFLNKLKLSKKNIIIINLIFIPFILLSLFNVKILYIFSPIIKLINNPVIMEKTVRLINRSSVSSLSILHTVEYFIIMLFLLISYDKYMEKFPQNKVFIKLFIVLIPLFTLLRNYEVLTRLKDYFTISYGVILSGLLSKRTKQNLIFYCILIIYCAFGFFRFLNLFDSGSLIPYRSYIFN
ncbi:EpsG family protein [Tissierella praeacuta]|uniref:EpsG family protein n=1 Tax=Tissierella praeacuta TaxID=43131 RepID=UPI00334150CD